MCRVASMLLDVECVFMAIICFGSFAIFVLCSLCALCAGIVSPELCDVGLSPR